MGNEHTQFNALCTPLITANEYVLETRYSYDKAYNLGLYKSLDILYEQY